MHADFRSIPADPASLAALAERGMRYDLLGATTAEQDAYSAAIARGFHSGAPDDTELAELRTSFDDRRSIGVWDDAAAEPHIPVATVASWPTPLRLPGGGAVEAWAISAVTVAPTHRRRGIARALLEGELRAAIANGSPMAALTVSESTLYGRYGFGIAAFAAELVIDTGRARWAGPVAPGRVQFVAREALRTIAPEIERRARAAGGIDRWSAFWDRQFGLRPSQAKSGAELRCVRYDDEAGEPQGFAIYRVTGGEADFTKHTVELVELVAASPEAYAGLWRFVLELDLVTEVTAGLRSVDEPLRWMIADVRGIRTRSVADHLWTRILDVPRCLEARRWQAPGEVVLEVTDPLGFAEGRYRLRVDAAGAATASVADASAVVELRLGVDALSSVHLGGVSPVTLAAAGRLHGDAEAVQRLHAMAVTSQPPVLAFWF